MWMQLFTVAVLSLIIYEDFRYRLVRVIFYLLILGLLFFQQSDKKVFELVLIHWLLNIGYILMLGSITMLYFYLKLRTLNILKFIGVGDILFLVAVASWFDPVEFIFFNTISLLVALAGHAILRKKRIYGQFETVPLAGIQSLCFIPLFLYTA